LIWRAGDSMAAKHRTPPAKVETGFGVRTGNKREPQ
jgi:hypothetical protein